MNAHHQQNFHGDVPGKIYTEDPDTSVPMMTDSKPTFSPFALDHLQDAAQFFLAAQSQPSLTDTGSGYQSSSAPSASGDPTPEPDLHLEPKSDRRPASVTRKSSEGAHRGHKHKWSAEETQALVDGCNKHGVGSWKKILSDPEISAHFSDRSAGDLKDRFRTYFPDSYHELYPNAKTHLSKAVRGRDSEGKSIFEKGKTKERRPFTPEEDGALRKGYLQHGSHWALIAKDPVFQGQRRAIDLRDRFRNAFPEDYERAGFKPRPSKAKKDCQPAKVGEAAEVLGSVSDHALSDSGWRGDYSMSDATSDGHLTDHGHRTDQANLTDGAEAVRSEPSSGASSVLGRSSSFNAAIAQSALASQEPMQSFGQATSQRSLPSMPSRPQYTTTHTAPVSSVAQRPSDMVTRQSISHLFEQLQQASLEGQNPRAPLGASRNFSTPPSANEGDTSQSFASLPNDDGRRITAKHTLKDAASHKRRSHTSKTGKISALERLPSVHGHLHGHPHHPHSHGPLHPHPYAKSLLSSPASGQTASQMASQSDVMEWLNPAQQSLQNAAAETMDVDDQGSVQSADLWPTYNTGTRQAESEKSASTSAYAQSTNYADCTVFSRQQGPQPPQAVGARPEMLVRSSSFHGAGSFSDLASSSLIDNSRRSSSGLNVLTQQQARPSQQQPLFTPTMIDKTDSYSSQTGLFSDPLQDFLDPLVPTSAVGSGWNSGWNLGSFSDSGRADDDDVGALLSSVPLSHHHWAGDLHHHSTSSTSWYNAQLQQNHPSYYGGASLSVQPSVNSASSEPFGTAASSLDTEAVLRAMSVDSYQQQQPAAASRTVFESANTRAERQGLATSLELNREQTFTARDVGSSQVQETGESGGCDSGDEQRRQSTDTLRRAEGSLEQALESVENTRALQFAQQFHQDDDSDEDANPGDDDGYEEDEEDDDEVDYEADRHTAPARSFAQVFDHLQTGVSDSYAASLPDTTLSSDFFDGPFDASHSGAGQTGFAVDDSNLALYQDLSRSPRFTADAQTFLASLNQEMPSWASAVSDSEMVRPYGRSAQSPTMARGSFGASSASAQSGARSASLASHSIRRMQPDASSSGHAPFLSTSTMPGQAVSLGAQPMTAGTSSGAGVSSGSAMDSLWATSGSLDRLEHLYLEGLHSSPAMSHASAAVGGDFGPGGNYAIRPGWMSNPGELAGGSSTGPQTGGYLSE